MRYQLVEQARAGDEASFEALLDLDGDRCFAIAFRILRDRSLAEDAVQQCFFQVWRELPRLRNVERYEVWLHRLLVNACYQELRHRRRWTDRTTTMPAQVVSDHDPYVAADEREALERAFERLSPDRRAVFVLHHHVGLPLAAIAEIVGKPVGTVKSRLHYAIQTLQSALAADARTNVPEARRA
jgi:RNA polymerase sigma-70 factor (ECF subfamily)